jgi:hypothetical protein
MPLPKRGEKETKEEFISRCMSDDKVNEEFPDNGQRYAVCIRQSGKTSAMEEADLLYNFESYGYTEELNENNFFLPEEQDYVDFGEEEMEWDIAAERPGLWENIRRKKEREGKDYKPAKRGDPDRPDPEAWKKAQSNGENETQEVESFANEYQGKKVKLNKPFRTPKGPKKFSVYVKNDKGNVVKVNFGDPNMDIKRDDPARRKSFRARHQCDTNPGPKWKARYWSCKFWESGSPVSKLT